MIKEPQRSYLLELITALGSAANCFVLTGAQSIVLGTSGFRNTKDFDFILDVISLRKSTESISAILAKLHYKVDKQAQKFQFTKEIPNSLEIMRIEFMASEKEKRPDDFRVDVQKEIHARMCTGAEIVLQESKWIPIQGSLPDGSPAEIKIRVAKPNAILMMKLFAMDDRYRNIRGSKSMKHDRERARVHTDDAITIVHNNIQNIDFVKLFWDQFKQEGVLKQRCNKIISEYFKNLDAPGCQLYREFLSEQTGGANEAEVNSALREMNLLI